MPPLISVVICTMNRYHYLEKALIGLQGQVLDKKDFETVIIDAGPPDNTPHFVTEYSECMTIQYFSAPGTGLSEARNLGIGYSSGEIIAFIDDDAIADPQWLDQIRQSFERPGEERVFACGGKSLLQCDAPSPAWLNDDMQIFLGKFDFGDAGFFMAAPDQNPAGLNMAIRKETFDRIGFFNEHLGRTKGTLLSNEEVDFFKKMRRETMGIWYNPRMLVYHIVPRQRMQKDFFYQRYYWQGRSDAVMNAVQKYSLKGIILAFLRVMRRFGRLVRAYLSLLSSTREKKLVAYRCDLMYHLGYLREQM